MQQHIFIWALSYNRVLYSSTCGDISDKKETAAVLRSTLTSNFGLSFTLVRLHLSHTTPRKSTTCNIFCLDPYLRPLCSKREFGEELF